MADRFSIKLKEQLLEATSGYCENMKCFNKGNEVHHILPNTIVNRKKYPLYTQSPFNSRLLCYDCHHNKPLGSKPFEKKLEMFEEYLECLKKGW